MARPRRRCCSCSWMAAAKRSHPSHTLSALLFRPFPSPPLTLTLLPYFFVPFVALGWPPDPLVSSKYDT